MESSNIFGNFLVFMVVGNGSPLTTVAHHPPPPSFRVLGDLRVVAQLSVGCDVTPLCPAAVDVVEREREEADRIQRFFKVFLLYFCFLFNCLGVCYVWVLRTEDWLRRCFGLNAWLRRVSPLPSVFMLSS